MGMQSELLTAHDNLHMGPIQLDPDGYGGHTLHVNGLSVRTQARVRVVVCLSDGSQVDFESYLEPRPAIPDQAA